jgi:hypothetical protein
MQFMAPYLWKRSLFMQAVGLLEILLVQALPCRYYLSPSFSAPCHGWSPPIWFSVSLGWEF